MLFPHCSCPQIFSMPKCPSSQEKKSWPYKRSHVEWSFEEKVQNGTILDLPSAKLQQLVQQLCCVSVGGHMGHRAECEWGVAAFPKSSHFLCCGSNFPIKTGRAKTCFCENWMGQLLDALLQHEMNLSHTQKLQPYWLFDEKTGQRVKKMQLSETAEIIPWNCHKTKVQLEKKPSDFKPFSHIYFL